MRISKKCYVWLSHFPIMDWDHAALGVLCGHCHGGSPHLNADDSSFGKIFDCGVDNALKLKNRIYFTLEECLDILRKKKNIMTYNSMQNEKLKNILKMILTTKAPCLIIIQGLPGSGKTTLAKEVSSQFNIPYFEADQYFEDKDGNYNFNPKYLHSAHIFAKLGHFLG